MRVAAMADEKKPAAKKRMDAAVKRALLGEERRIYNKSRKSACATRIKKVGPMPGLGALHRLHGA